MRIETLSVREAREQLPSVLERFRSGDRTPVGVGAHRRTEAVVVPVEVYDELTAQRASHASQALASLRVEGGWPSGQAQFVIDRWVHGEIDTAEMERQIKSIHGLK